MGGTGVYSGGRCEGSYFKDRGFVRYVCYDKEGNIRSRQELMLYQHDTLSGQLESVCKPRPYREIAEEVNRERGPAMPTDPERQRLEMQPETQVNCCEYY